jgi:hypothetical protein
MIACTVPCHDACYDVMQQCDTSLQRASVFAHSDNVFGFGGHASRVHVSRLCSGYGHRLIRLRADRTRFIGVYISTAYDHMCVCYVCLTDVPGSSDNVVTVTI